MRNKLTGMMLLATATLGLFSCADITTPDVGNNTEKYAYFNTAFTLPSSSFTRSKTDDPDIDGGGTTNSDAVEDFEIGKDYENEIRSVLLVIATPDNKYITHVAMPTVERTSTTTEGIRFTATSRIPYDVLEYAYTQGPLKDNQAIRLYAYCNYTDDIKEAFDQYQTATDKDWRNYYGIVEEVAGKEPQIWAQRSFLMTNAISTKDQKYSFPANIDLWENHAVKEKALDLTEVDGEIKPIKVERAVARFDFKDASTAGNCTYPITDGPEGNVQKYQVLLTEMSLVNMSNQFYYLRRVSDDGLNLNLEIGGKETVKKDDDGNDVFNYVVDVDAVDKKEVEGINPKNAAEHFNFCLFDENGKYKKDNWYTSNIEEVLGHEEDQWNKKPGDYHIWRYVTENTIPQPESQQKNIQSTGIVFKAQIMPKDGETDDALADALDAGEETLYSYSGILYVGIDGLVDAVNSDESGQSSPLYKALAAALETMGKTVEDLSSLSTVDDIITFNKAAAKFGGITVYTPGDEDGNSGYYCYYFYWNRHNDNGKPSKMGPMEFATVRNNVYKLSVTSINQLGHPLDPDNDPDPVEPEDPDEDDTNYIKVAIEVLPWVVRVNEITF